MAKLLTFDGQVINPTACIYIYIYIHRRFPKNEPCEFIKL